jgi:hypothetical protein
MEFRGLIDEAVEIGSRFARIDYRHTHLHITTYDISYA